MCHCVTRSRICNQGPVLSRIRSRNTRTTTFSCVVCWPKLTSQLWMEAPRCVRWTISATSRRLALQSRWDRKRELKTSDRKVVDLESLAAHGALKIMVSDKGGNLTNWRPDVLHALGVGSDLIKANRRGILLLYRWQLRTSEKPKLIEHRTALLCS